MLKRILHDEISRELHDIDGRWGPEAVERLVRRVLKALDQCERDEIFPRYFRHDLFARLDRLEHLFLENSQCAFAESGAVRYPQWLSQIPSPGASIATAADPEAGGFWGKLAKLASLGSEIVLVDPYACSSTSDDNKKVSPAKLVGKLLKDCSFDRLHLYCRQDAYDEAAAEELKTSLNGKLSIYFGDLHDRYLLVGNDQVIKHGSCQALDTDWHGLTYWAGAAFGASLNGVTKRPTYVLGLEKGDVPGVRKYLDGSCKRSNSGSKKNPASGAG